MIIRVNVVLSLTLKMTNAHVRFSKRQSLAINNSPIQDYVHADDLAPPNYYTKCALYVYRTVYLITNTYENWKFIRALVYYKYQTTTVI